MRILYVEDDEEQFGFVTKRLAKDGENSVLLAVTNKQAKELVASNPVDYVVLDLAIPLEAPEGDPSIDHGIELALFLRKNYPGTPILVLTGQSSEPATQALEDDDTFAVFWNGARKPLFKIRKKRQLDDALRVVEEAAQLLNRLDALELSLQDDEARNLSVEEKRIVRLFALKNNAVLASVSQLSGGLSGARVLRVRLLNGTGEEFQHAVAKIDTFESIGIESENYDRHVQQLDVGSFPTSLGEFFTGCGPKKGVFFQLASNFDKTLFEFSQDSDVAAADTLAKLRIRLRNWHRNFSAKRMTIRDVRRTQLCDEKFGLLSDLLEGLDIETFEDKSVQIRWATQHGDMHGANILVSDVGDAVVIDYGDIGEGICSLDPTVLELSFYFHPNARDQFAANDNIAKSWFSDRIYDNVLLPLSTKALRDWGVDNQFSGNEFVAVTYAYCVRQLSYDGTDKAFAIALIREAMSVIE